jgi:hypothetical protein
MRRHAAAATANRDRRDQCGRAGAVARREPAEPMRDPRAEVMAEYFDVMRGFLEQQRAVVESWHTRPAEEVADAPEASAELPFLDEIVVHEEHRIVARCSLSLGADNFLRSHVLSGPVSEGGELSGLACVPLMVSVEVLAEACSVLAGSRSLHVIENVRAFDWIALDDEALTLEVHARRSMSSRASIARRSSTALRSPFPPISVSRPPSGSRASASWVLREPSRWSGPELYTTGMFHGPVFQSVRRVAGWNETGIDAELFEADLQGFFSPGATPRLVLNPVLLDAVGQVAAYWVAQQAGVDFNCFPSTIGRIELYAPCPAGISGSTMRGRQRPLEGDPADISAARTWSFECLDAAGAALFGSMASSTSSSPCRAPSTRCGATRCEGCSARRARCGRRSASRCGRCRTMPRTSAPSRTRSSCASWRTRCLVQRSAPNGGHCRGRCGTDANGCSGARRSRRQCG